jgi:hypothetical protein
MRGLWLVAVGVIASGCQYDPNAHLLTTVKPEVRNVVGRYVLKRAILDGSEGKRVEGLGCSLVLAADGSFEATNLPPWSFRPSGARFSDTLTSGLGTWELATVASVDDGSEIKQAWGVQLTSEMAQFQSPGLTGNTPPYGILITIGDPDSGHALIFEKVE